MEKTMKTQLKVLNSDSKEVQSLDNFAKQFRFSKFTTSKDMYVGTMSADEWMVFPTIPINREVTHRVNNVRWVQAIDKQTPSVMKIALVYVDKDINVQKATNFAEVEEVVVQKGYYILDGNTRKHYYITSPDKKPTCDFLIEMYVARSERELDELYYSYDNQGAVETNAHKLSGAFRLFNLQFKAPRLQKGGIITALNIAYPDKDETDLFKKVAYFKDELLLMDKLNVFDPAVKTITNFQAFWASCLMMAKQYEDTIYMQQVSDALTRFGRTDKGVIGKQVTEGTSNGFDGVTAIWNLCLNYAGNPEIHKIWKQPNGETFEGTLKSTKHASVVPQMDIILDFLDRYIKGKKPIKNQPDCEGTYKFIQKELFEALYDE
jgi:hypothetical protein